MTVQWGVLSTARINDKFLAGAAASDRLTVSAVASRDEERARAYARQHSIPRAYGDYDELLADDALEAVYISLPNALHLEWTERALRAGKHVLCEKPLSRRAADVEAAFDLAASCGRLLMEAFMYRHHPQTARVRELVDAGAIGALRTIRATFGFAIADQDDVRLSPGLDGGALMDVGCYCVSGARLLAGEPESVSGQQVIGGDTAPGARGGVDVAFAGAMRFPGGVLSVIDAGLAQTPCHELEVVGERAALRVADPWHCREPGIELLTPDGVERIAVDRADSYRLEAENLSAAIRGQGEPLLGRDDAVGQARAIEQLYASAAG